MTRTTSTTAARVTAAEVATLASDRALVVHMNVDHWHMDAEARNAATAFYGIGSKSADETGPTPSMGAKTSAVAGAKKGKFRVVPVADEGEEQQGQQQMDDASVAGGFSTLTKASSS